MSTAVRTRYRATGKSALPPWASLAAFQLVAGTIEQMLYEGVIPAGLGRSQVTSHFSRAGPKEWRAGIFTRGVILCTFLMLEACGLKP
jgi:hypothetical protein